MLCSWRKAQQSLGVAMSQVSGPVQFSSFAQSCLTLWDSMDCNTPGFPVHHQLPRVSWNSCLLSRWCHLTISSSVSPSPPALNLSQHQGLLQWVSSFFFFFFPMSQIFAGPVSPFSTRSEERSLVSQGPCCLQSWLEAVPGKCALNAHILTDRFQSTDTKP